MPVPSTYLDVAVNESRGRTLVPAIPDELERVFQYTSLQILSSTGWGRADLDDIRVRSVVSHERTTWVVGQEGEVWTLPQGASPPEFVREQLPDSGHTDGRRLGPPRLMRMVEGKLYVCGCA
jgi:hypothetical protein